LLILIGIWLAAGGAVAFLAGYAGIRSDESVSQAGSAQEKECCSGMTRMIRITQRDPYQA
jgi:hypothetical protein